VTITGLPRDLTGFSGGTYTSALGTWTGTANEFNALAFAAGQTTGTFDLSIAATTTGPEAASTTESYTLTINTAGPPATNVSVTPAGGNENQSIDLSHAIAISANYLYTELTVPGDTSNSAYAFAINDAGQVLGSYYNAGQRTYFLYDTGTGVYTDILDPNAAYGTNIPYQGGLTEAGQVLGTYNDSSGAQIPFIYDSRNDGYTEIKDPNGPTNDNLQAVNSTDRAIGYYFDQNFNTKLFFYDGAGNYIPVNGPSPNDSPWLVGLNDAGQVLGSYDDSNHVQRGFIWDSRDASYTADILMPQVTT
jgi:hypothetical protein